VAELAAGATQMFTLTGTIAALLDRCLSNTANVTSATADSNANDNTPAVLSVRVSPWQAWADDWCLLRF
jgi:hypothetical protein